MTDREKTIKGLECCMTMPDIYPRCEECPYAGAEGTCGNLNGLHRDAIALLKAQAPRMMTLDEAKSAFVIEYRSGKLKEVGMTILDIDKDPANAYYGVIYRVWTSRPTDEQKEATPWPD